MQGAGCRVQGAGCRVQGAGAVPDIGHELAGLGVLDPGETVEDRVALLLDEGVDDRLDSPHRGVVCLLLPVAGGRVAGSWRNRSCITEYFGGGF